MKHIPPDHENPALCSSCKGKCCKRMACMVFPCDLKEITIGSLKEKLAEGYCFDSWEGNPTQDSKYDEITAYFMRPRHKDKLEKTYDPGWGGECIFLTKKGCSLSEKERPSGGRALIPEQDKCKPSDGWTKKDCSIAWLKYNDLIEIVLFQGDEE